MQTHISQTPEYSAGTHISTLLHTDTTDQPILVLLAGGTALCVLEHIDESKLGPHVTIMMGDERFTNDPKLNNFLQLKKTSFYRRARAHNVNSIETVPDTVRETPTSFAAGINKTLQYYFKTRQNAYVICLFGIGTDGHFASVFPDDSRASFYKKFHTDALYIATHTKSSTPTDRVTLTPYFIKHHADEIILYATGEEKCNGVLKDLQLQNAKEHELPAHIPSRHPQSHLFTDCSHE